MNFISVNLDFTDTYCQDDGTLRPVPECDFDKKKDRPSYKSIEEEVFLEELSIKQKEECTREGIYTGITPRKDSEASDGTYSERWKVRW